MWEEKLLDPCLEGLTVNRTTHRGRTSTMESFQLFEKDQWTVDRAKNTITKNAILWKTVYGGVPMLCNGKVREVHQFELRILKTAYGNFVIGIDSQRTNTSDPFWISQSHHYGLECNGRFFTKGTVYIESIDPIIHHVDIVITLDV